jgi:nitroreductase
MSFAELTRTRFSCRKYEDRAVEPEVLEAVIETGRIAPSACNNHPTRIIVCNSPETREKAAACSRFGRDGSIFGAPVVLVVCAKTDDAWVRKYDQMNSSEIDTSIVVDQMMMQATDLGLGTCWVCHFDPEEAIKQFDLPEGLYPISMLPLGYPAETIAEPEAREKRCISRKDFVL